MLDIADVTEAFSNNSLVDVEFVQRNCQVSVGNLFISMAQRHA